MSIAVAIDQLLALEIPFACWASGGDQFQAIIDKKPMVTQSLPTLNNVRGFVFAPFEASKRTPIVLLRPEIYLQNAADIERFARAPSWRETIERQQSFATMQDSSANQLPILSDGEGSSTAFVCGDKKEIDTATDWATYKAYVSKAISELQNSQLSKVVLSKTTDKLRNDESIGELFSALQRSNPDVFVYVINIPTLGLWLGATPETLLHSDDKLATVISLAGTQPLREDHDYCWRAKEIEEQAFVSRYTVDTLNRYGVSHYHTAGPENYETSAVTHLKTTFSFSPKAISARLGEFITDLSPTPAVCGLPKIAAKQWISNNEPHQRGYYTGFLGAWRLQRDQVDLFVNIRCLQVLPDCYRLYTGGGITAKSDVQAEWEETERKANTLLSIISQFSEKL